MTTRYDDRGIAHPLALILVAIVLGAVGFAAWRVMEKDKNGSSNSSAVTAEMKQVEKECNDKLKDKDFCKFASSFNGEAPYKAVMMSTGSEGTGTSELESDGKGNTAMVSKKDGKLVGAFITLDGVSYFKDLDSDTWFKMPSNNSEEDSQAPDDNFKIDIKEITQDDKTSYKKLGKEKCGSLNCFKYQVIDSESPDTEQFIWFDDRDYRMQRFSTKSPEGSSDMTFTYTPVKIEAPSPVKDFSVQSNSDVDAAIRAAQEAMTAGEE